ncbi:hypothetical protein PybrP1_010862 [[Pythium] brassicae (nom. inval.)]|nr:hypothetical protein PybrP1_010862 [[Pythium] brassicae (nom. inval.)]
MALSPRSPAPFEQIETPTEKCSALNTAGDAQPESLPSKLWRWYFGIPGILLGAVVGILIGYAIQTGEPSEELVTWVGTPGRLFIRAIKSIVTPVVLCSLVVGMADMLAVGKASTIGVRTVLLYLFTTVVASCEGLLFVAIFRPHFGNKARPVAESVAELAFQCDQPGYFLTESSNGTLACAFDAEFNATALFPAASKFTVKDVNGYFATTSAAGEKRTLSKALQDQLDALVPSNITLAFSEATLLSIITFAIAFGIAISLLPRDAKVVGTFFRELNMVFMTMIAWVIKCTPVAIISLLASSIATQDDMSVLVHGVGLYVLCDLLVFFVHVYIFYPVLLRVFVKINPFRWLFQMARAQVFAFGSSSSMATLPVVMECVEATKEVTQTLSRFVLSLGATIGMDGAALGYPVAIVFMAEAEGLGHLIGGVEYFLIVLVSTIGAIGAGPVPSYGSVVTITIWTSVFPDMSLPSTYGFILATDWFIDRFQTAVNVTCDTIVCRIVAQLVGETVEDEMRASLNSAVSELKSHNPSLKDIEFSDAKVDA